MYEDFDFDNDDDFDEDLDHCYECSGYGDDYELDDNGDLVCRCTECPFNPFRGDDWDD